MKVERQEQRGLGPEHDAFVSKFSKDIFITIVANPRTWINPDYQNKAGTVVAYIRELQHKQEKDPNTKLEDLEDPKEWLEWFHGVTRNLCPEVKSIRDLRNTNMGSYTGYLKQDIKALQQRQRTLGQFEGQNTNVDLDDVVNDINRESVKRLDETQAELLDILYKEQITKDDVKRTYALHEEIKQLAPSH